LIEEVSPTKPKKPIKVLLHLRRVSLLITMLMS